MTFDGVYYKPTCECIPEYTGAKCEHEIISKWLSFFTICTVLSNILFFLTIMLILFLFSGYYSKKDNKHCANHEYGDYGTLEEAKLACSSDHICAGVYDMGCNNVNRFTLCPHNYIRRSGFSCVHIKMGKHIII